MGTGCAEANVGTFWHPGYTVRSETTALPKIKKYKDALVLFAKDKKYKDALDLFAKDKKYKDALVLFAKD